MIRASTMRTSKVFAYSAASPWTMPVGMS